MDIHKKVTTFVFVTLMSTNIQAENVGLHLGAQLWNSKPNGAFGEKSNLTRAETDRDQNISYFIELIHPYQLLPNVRIESTSYDASGQAEFSREYSNDTDIAHVDVLENVTANTRFNISHVDYTFFYQLFNNEQLSLDLGLTARDYGDGLVYTESADITTTTRDFIWDGPDHDDHDYHNIVEKTQKVNKENLNVDEIEPMVFLASKIVTPVEGLSAFVQANYSIASEHSIYDYQVGLDYDLIDTRMVDLNLFTGYRSAKIDLEDLDGLYSNIDFKGAFVGFSVRF